MKYYTGIGSRQTPAHVIAFMTMIAKKLCREGYTLRSGGADGADCAFEKGAGSKKQIFLPWKGFNRSGSQLFHVPEEVRKFSLKYHPVGDSLGVNVQKIMGRNAQQVLGPNLGRPSKFLLCWTPFDTEEVFEPGSRIGGTGQAIRIAHDPRVRW